jgi:hypothetical protein
MRRSGVFLFTFTSLLSAWLVFWMEPLYAKMLLPVFGGAPHVWITALMFFQTALLIGYVYAHFLQRLRNPLVQGAIHLAVALLTLTSLPPVVGAIDIASINADPLFSVLAMLTRGIALPMIVLSATAPLLQHWFSLSTHERADDPYFLYAASNLGSFGALLAFPLLLEPALPMTSQTILWSVLFGVAIVLIIACSYLVRSQQSAPAPALAGDAKPSQNRPQSQDGNTIAQWFWWIILAAVPASLLAGVTTIITTDIAAMPLLWVLPLMVYLGTYVLAFAGITLFPPLILRLTISIAVIAIALAQIEVFQDYLGLNANVEVLLISVYLVGQFFLSLACHGALYARRPQTSRLTEFYVAVAIGGLTGGAFNAVVAPQIFTAPAEFSIAIVLALALSRRQWEPLLPANKTWTVLIIGALIGGFAGIAILYAFPVIGLYLPGLLWKAATSQTVWAAACVGLIVLVRFPMVQAGALAFGLMATTMFMDNDGQIHAERSFFGTIRVIDDYDAGIRAIKHGTTHHGAQNLYPPIWKEPLSYFGDNSPISEVFSHFEPALAGGNIGAVGMGAGTLACYHQPGQAWQYYEIDPAIVRIATDPEFFTYISGCDPDASVENGSILVGDARLQISQGDAKFDLLILDAFTSDAIPLHLLTLEAIQVYLDHLQPHGLIAIHISNRHIDLKPALARAAQELELALIFGKSTTRNYKKSKSDWLVLSRDEVSLQGVLDAQKGTIEWARYNAPPGAPLWTDDYSNIFTSLKIRY